jgi:ribose transport system substrate-binding protein
MSRRTTALRALATGAAVVAMAACGQSGPAPIQKAEGPIGSMSGTLYETKGPNGETSTPAADVALTEADLAKVRAGRHKAALLWHTSSPDQESVTAGAKSVFDAAGVEIVGTAAADFDPAKQASQVQTMLARKPDLMLAVPVDPAASTASFRPAVKAGVKLVVSSVVPEGYVHGEDYVGLVNGDLAEMGKRAAEMLGKSMGGKGKVGLIYYDANFFATNTRDLAFRSWMQRLYPDIQLVQQGMADPAKAQEAASALLARYPDLGGFYVPWAAPPAQGVVAALRSNAKKDVKVVTFDLDPAVALDMVRGEYVIGEVVNPPFVLGETMAKLALWSLVKGTAPEFVVTPPVTVTKDNLAEVWKQSTGEEPPAAVARELAAK